ICLEAPIGIALSDLMPREMNKDKLAELLTKLELRKFLDKYGLKEADIKQEVETKYEYNLDEPLEPILHDMEKVGFSVDKDSLIEYGKELDSDLKEQTERIYFLAGEKFNINSPKQLGEVLFSHLGILGGKKTKTGYSTDAETLEKLAHYHPVINEVISYRKLAKLKSTYVDGLVDKIGNDGKLHTTFNLDKTRTGRLSSSDPNLQNIPVRTERGSQLRKFFVASPGKVLVDADYSQIELRVLAYMAQDKAMLEASIG
ncbi:MAG: DNA polymerase, partial [Clostridia bacterium]|nr:DNA polymerase [Clostridia bacterium]